MSEGREDQEEPLLPRLLGRLREPSTRLRLAGRCLPPALFAAALCGAFGGAAPGLIALVACAPPLLVTAATELALREAGRDTPALTCLAVWTVGTLAGLALMAQALYVRDLWASGAGGPLRSFEQLLTHSSGLETVYVAWFCCALLAAGPAVAAIARGPAPRPQRVTAALCAGLGIYAVLIVSAYLVIGRVRALHVGLLLALIAGCYSAWLWVVDSAALRAEGAVPRSGARRGLRLDAEVEDDAE
ncbi:MAG: hypothetical protein AB7N76_15310 [Planctomycetota bacterium]